MYSAPEKFLWPVANLKFDVQDAQCLRREGIPAPCSPYSICSPAKKKQKKESQFDISMSEISF